MAGGLFSVSGTDKSLEYLGVIFGPMGNLPLGAGNILFSKLIYVLNQVILTLGFIIVSYTLFISTISTAQEGEVMGKKWSSIWVPARAATGIYLLLPSASGYCWIQIGVMWFLIQGIGAANTIWEQVLYSFQTEGSISEPAPPALEKTGPLLKGILEAKICQHELNTNPTHQTQLNNQQIVLYRLGDEMIWGTADGKKHCGKIILPSFTPPISLPPFTPSPDTERKQGIIASAIEDIDSNFDNVAIEAD
ncbi:MAG TPA: DotA/TraY family protein, partial [Gammaproteobacteria bacterium]|nr:DotA/TraY family protein [Gammaproteobacteria bacterium]